MRRLLTSAGLPLLVVLSSAAPAAAQSEPACPDGTPAALRFDGLPARIEYGPNRSFGFAETYNDWTLSGLLHVTMLNGGRTLFDVDEFDSLFVQLDVGDSPTTVTVSFPQEDDISDAPMLCTATIRRAVRGFRRFRVNDQCDYGSPSARPRRIVIACGDGNLQLVGLRWRAWNRSTARASGKIMANECIPYCAAGHFRYTRSRVVVSRARGGRGAPYRYTRLRYLDVGRWQRFRLRGSYWIEAS